MHDEFFKYNLKRREILIEILKMSLSEDFFDIINSSRIESEKTDFITERLEKHQGDALFKVFLGDKESFIYILFEHKSRISSRLGAQLLKYLDDIIQREVERTEKIIPIIPIVVYNGEENKNPSGEFLSEYSYLKQMPERTQKKLLNFSYYFLDISKVDKTKLGEMTSLFFKVFSDGTRNKENIIENFHKHTKVFKDVWGEEKTSALIAYMTYIIKNSTKDDRQTTEKILKEVLGEEKGEKEMETMLDILNREAREEGIILGRKEGIEEGMFLGMKENSIRTARQLIILGLSTEKIALITGLSLKEVEALR